VPPGAELAAARTFRVPAKDREEDGTHDQASPGEEDNALMRDTGGEAPGEFIRITRHPRRIGVHRFRLLAERHEQREHEGEELTELFRFRHWFLFLFSHRHFRRRPHVHEDHSSHPQGQGTHKTEGEHFGEVCRGHGQTN